MAFSFVKNKTTTAVNNNGQQHQQQQQIIDKQISPKLTNSQLNLSTKSYPNWLKENASNLKQLPGIYQGVLGQVQLQADFLNDLASKSSNNSAIKLVSNCNRKDNPCEYMNRFTDTERVKQLLFMSRLSNETLATIWAHVNKTFPGRLTNREVCLALALIALFQKLDKDSKEYNQVAGTKYDPFIMIKVEKKPPVPTLYSCHNDNLSLAKKSNQKMTTSNSVPSELSSSKASVTAAKQDCLLIDFTGSFDENNDDQMKSQQQTTNNNNYDCNLNKNSINLIDTDAGDSKGEFISKLKQIWLKTMVSMRNVFKRSFDILNVENDRQSAIEAINSPKGIEFCKNLCLCYPIAHNIKYKIDELNRKNLLSAFNIDSKDYMRHLDDLMISINEYWAVLMNLFHESGLTNFIELILDGLNRTNETVISKNYGELMIELDVYNSSNNNKTCAICQTKFYLVNIGDVIEKRDIPEEDLKLVLDQEVITNDERFYYHARCANFWLNNVDSQSVDSGEGGQLPFCEQQMLSCEILKPTSF